MQSCWAAVESIPQEFSPLPAEFHFSPAGCNDPFIAVVHFYWNLTRAIHAGLLGFFAIIVR